MVFSAIPCYSGPMKIASWNVNSIKARKDHVLRWLKGTPVDALMIQELKGETFPEDDFKQAGYESLYAAQKTYNGVAILTKQKAELVLDKLPGDESDEQARYLEVNYKGLRLINIYLPNGNPVFDDTHSPRKRGSSARPKQIPDQVRDDAYSIKYDYKLNWMERLYERLKKLREEEIPFLVGGDFNVIPEERDCYDPRAWKDDALFLPQSRAAFRALQYLGLTDAFRAFHSEAGHYTFWDYQAGAWPKNHGIRIDHFLTSPAVTDRLKNCSIDAAPRGEDKASDHTPIILEL